MVELDTNQFLSQVDFMPINLIDKLLSTLTPHPQWEHEINARIEALKLGSVTLVDGNEVFQKIKKRFA